MCEPATPIDILLVATVLLGMGATTISASLCCYFSKSRERLAKATSFMLLGEVFANGVVTVFAFLQLTGKITDLTPIQASTIRWVALTVAVVSSLHMAKVIKEIEDGRYNP